jgi:hypothetical protein
VIPAATTPAKKINGRKRFIVTDTLGLLLVVVVLPASTQDRDGAKPVLLETCPRTRVRFVFADGGFAGRLLDWHSTSCTPPCTSCVNPPGNMGSPSFLAGGRLSARSPGGLPTAAWPATTNATRPCPKP